LEICALADTLILDEDGVPAKPRLRRLRVEWSGTAISNPSKRRTERVKPSAWRNARWKTSRSVSTTSMAMSA